MRRAPRFTVALMAALILGACTNVNKASSKTTPTSSAPGSLGISEEEISRLEASHLKVIVKGKVAFTYDQDAELRIVVMSKPEFTDVGLLSVGIHDMKPVRDKAQFRIAFDLVGIYEGSGKYKLPAAGQSPTATPSQGSKDPNSNTSVKGLSKLYLFYTENPEPDTVVYDFQEMVEGCSVEVGEGESTGKITCPKVADAVTKDTVSVEMIWGPKKN